MAAQSTIRIGGIAGIAGPVIFNLGWLIAQLWQPDTYSPSAHTISDMYAYGAPHSTFLIACVVLCGIGTIMLATLAVRPVVTGHWTGTVAWILIAVSIFGLGSVVAFVGREACQLAAPGCTAADQLSNFGGMLDAVLSTFGAAAMVLAGFFLASALRRRPGLSRFTWPSRAAGMLIFVIFVLNGLLSGVGLGGLAERALAIIGSVALILLSLLVLRYQPKATPDHRFRSTM